ncbi:MAG: SCP2 sterol-binding domain-containing protein [Pseudomonadota bacterium]
MSRYITPLPGMLAGLIEGVFQRALQLDAQAGDRLAALDGKSVKLALDAVGIDLFFTGTGQTLTVRAESDDGPDTIVRGTPSALLALAVPDWRASGSGVRIEGDAGTAQALEQLFRRLDPDWERLLTDQFGEIIGHQMWRLAQDALQIGREGARLAGDQVGHYLREESGLLVTPDEVQQFTSEVDELREAVDRLESRLRRQQRQAARSEDS